MAEFDNLLEAYFTSKDTDDPENERIALEVVEKVVQELEDNLKNEEDFNEAKLYQSIKKYLSENDADKNKRVAIYFLNDLERQLKHKGYADESSGIDFNYLLYEFGKNDYSVIDQYFDIFNVDNVIRMIFGSPYLSEKQKYHLLDKAKLEQEQWNILYFNFKSRDMGFDDKEFNDMLSYLSLKAAGQAAGEAAEKEIIDNNWTEVSLNQYIQQGASSSALGLIAALRPLYFLEQI